MIGEELVDQAVRLLSTGIAVIMEDHAGDALDPGVSADLVFAELRQAGSDIAILAAACEVLRRRRG